MTIAVNQIKLDTVFKMLKFKVIIHTKSIIYKPVPPKNASPKYGAFVAGTILSTRQTIQPAIATKRACFNRNDFIFSGNLMERARSTVIAVSMNTDTCKKGHSEIFI